MFSANIKKELINITKEIIERFVLKNLLNFLFIKFSDTISAHKTPIPISNILLVVKKKFASDENLLKYDADIMLNNIIVMTKYIRSFFLFCFKKKKKN